METNTLNLDERRFLLRVLGIRARGAVLLVNICLAHSINKTEQNKMKRNTQRPKRKLKTFFKSLKTVTEKNFKRKKETVTVKS